ncbi:MAG: aminoacyl-tRNA hydrolase [Flammeovirgaceae bacterium]|nr:aminoacyl-tRNA hydrolase [Flammeovirgaceae bacterium]
MSINRDVLLSELTFQTSRSSGPGGQNVNKVNSKVTIRWNIQASAVISEEQKIVLLRKLKNQLNKEGVLILSAQGSRSQLQNKESVLSKLEALIKKALTVKKKRKPTKASKASKRKRLDSKKRHAEKKLWRKKM